jgi:hypothetical protein
MKKKTDNYSSYSNSQTSNSERYNTKLQSNDPKDRKKGIQIIQ